MDTLIYFVQAVIELLFLSFLVSFRFAYQQQATAQPTFEQQQQQQPVRRTTLQRSTRISSVKRPVWDKRRQLAVARLSQSDESLSILVSPSAQKNNGVTSSSSIVAVAQTSGTGSLSLTPRHVQSPINSGQLPPPPSIPLIPQPSLVPHSHSLPPSPVATTESKSSSPTSLEPTTRSPSAAKSPRRKPVQSKHSRKSSAKFDRPPLPPPETALPQSPPSIDGQVQTQFPPVLDKKSLETTPVQNSPKKSEPLPSFKKKSSAKSLRPPVPAVQLAPQTRPILSAPIIQSYSPPQNPVDQIANSSPHPLVRKSSAKFIRPPPNNPSDPSPIEPPTTAESQSLEGQYIPTEPPSIDNPPTFEQPPTIEEPPTIDPPTVEEPPPVEEPATVEEQPEPEADAPLALLEPVPQRPISQPKVTLFPPRPAIALAQPVSDPVKPPPREQSPWASSFPELPPLVLTNPRQPPPPPSIPRFPSPPKSVISSPSPPPRVYSNPGRQISPSPSSSSRRHVSMAAVSTYAEDVETSSENWALTEDAPERYARTDFPREWDPSQDENIFEPNSTSVPKAVVSTTTPDERFSFHGSIASSSSNDSAPRNRSPGRLSTQSSSPNLLDRPKHTRAVSTNSQNIPSPMPSPRARPHSAGSLSSGSEYVPPQFLFDNTHLKPGNAAALLTHAETLNLYRQNAKKAVDNPATQYEFAIFMMDAAREATLDLNGVSPTQRDEFLKEGLSILRRLADRGYPQAQYYLADCYSNGIGCKHGTPDLDKAFPLFVLAAKHGHVEASFRTALAYENAWGCRKDPLKALQFLR
jgi:TPR repeat protein